MGTERRFVINLGGLSDTDSDEENNGTGFTFDVTPGGDCPKLIPNTTAVLPAPINIGTDEMPILQKENSTVKKPMVIIVKVEWDSYTAYLTTPGVIGRGLVPQIERVLRENGLLLDAGIAIIATPGRGTSSDAASRIHFVSDTGLEIKLLVDKQAPYVSKPRPTTPLAGGGDGQMRISQLEDVKATPKKTAAAPGRHLQPFNYSYTEERWGEDEDEGYFTKEGKKCASPISRGNRPCPRRILFPNDEENDYEAENETENCLRGLKNKLLLKVKNAN